MFFRLSCQYFLAFALIGVFAPYFALYLHARAVDAGEIALLLAIMQAMRMLAPLAWGKLADGPLTPRRGLLLSAAGSVLALLALANAQTMPGRLAAMMVLAFFWSATLPLLETRTLASLGTQAARYGAIRRWGSFGFIVAVLVMGRILEVSPATVVPWACGLMFVGLLLMAGGPQEVPRRQRADAATAPSRGLLTQASLLAIFAAGFLMAAAHGPLNVFYSIHLASHGYGGTLIGVLWALGALAEVALLPLLSRLECRFPPQRLLLACFAVAALRFLAIGWGAASLFVLVFAQLLHVLSFGAHHALTVTTINRHCGEGNQARSLALYTSCQGGGALAGSLLSGLSWNACGSAWTFSLGAGLALAGMLLIQASTRRD